MDIDDVRRALWAAYKKEEKSEYGIEGKSNEAFCSVEYPNYWECETEEEFLMPDALMVYSYALGPSRTHYFKYGKKDKEINYYTWESPDIYAKAVEVINSWVD